MPVLPSSLIALLSLLEVEFTRPGYRNFCALAHGFLGRVGEHTVTGMWKAARLAGRVHHARAHAFFSRARWSPDALGVRLLGLLIERFVPAGEPARQASDQKRRQLYETAAAFGESAHHIKVGNIPETPCPLERLIEEYAALCDDAAQHTNAKVAYEIIPFDPNVSTLQDGLRQTVEYFRSLHAAVV